MTVPGDGRRPLVSFVGAGPGDPELITVRGLRRLREADLIVHDRLVPTALLAEASADAELIDVGKAPGRHCLAQDQINRLLVERACAGRFVVRLKGGDPAIFGRLAEEVRAARAARIPVEIVPGVTAGTAGAARAGISLTERGGASLIVFATATDRAGGLASGFDWGLLARAQATLVFYMAVRRLATVTATLISLGRDPGAPALVAENVGRPHERLIAGPLARIAADARAAQAASPAIMICGPTVASALAGLERSRFAEMVR
jgi:uroporphyrin-III C-methyltransferase